MGDARLRTGLIGDNISRTRLPAALDIMCRDAGIALTFEPIDTAGHAGFDLAACVAELRSAGWDGVAVTHPHKPAAAGLFDGPARRLGAANLLVFGTAPAAHNTDYTGFVSAWRALRGPAAPGRVAMAGAGGVARAIATGLAGLGATEIAIWDTAPGRAAALAAEIGPAARAVPPAGAGAAIASADGLVNATHLGMAGYGGSAFELPLTARPAWAFDAVYTPVETAFLQSARAAGAEILTGFELFRHMAVNLFTALTGQLPAPDILHRLDRLQPPREQAE